MAVDASEVRAFCARLTTTVDDGIANLEAQQAAFAQVLLQAFAERQAEFG